MKHVQKDFILKCTIKGFNQIIHNYHGKDVGKDFSKEGGKDVRGTWDQPNLCLVGTVAYEG